MNGLKVRSVKLIRTVRLFRLLKLMRLLRMSRLFRTLIKVGLRSLGLACSGLYRWLLEQIIFATSEIDPVPQTPTTQQNHAKSKGKT